MNPFQALANQSGYVSDARLLAIAFATAHEWSDVYPSLRFAKRAGLTDRNVSGYLDGFHFEAWSITSDLDELRDLAQQYLEII